jgi:DNA sulfur modification protein DndD
MYIESIRLQDWKAYVDETFRFPRPTKKKNVVLVGAMNGYGKTSLLEALILGLFGREGLGVLGRAVAREGESDKISYDNFLERALHARALEGGRRSTSVAIAVKGDDESITIERKWHFSPSGKHQREDEEVRIWTGPQNDIVKIPKAEDRDEFLRTFLPQRFVPVDLAQFFLFDGEQVQRLAQREMSDQVRLGIEAMLGVPVLRELSRDLVRTGASILDQQAQRRDAGAPAHGGSRARHAVAGGRAHPRNAVRAGRAASGAARPDRKGVGLPASRQLLESP